MSFCNANICGEPVEPIKWTEGPNEMIFYFTGNSRIVFTLIQCLAVCRERWLLRVLCPQIEVHCKYIRCKNYCFSLCPVSRCTFAVHIFYIEELPVVNHCIFYKIQQKSVKMTSESMQFFTCFQCKFYS